MKDVVLSADGDRIVYSVPDIVAENLEAYCMEFCSDWIWNSPDAEKYRTNAGVCYTEADFIAYLNRFVFPHEESKMLRNLGWIESEEDYPEEYRDTPRFNF